LVKEIYKIVRNNKSFSQDYGLKDQIQRAVVSVMSNIAEGYARNSDKEFLQFLYIARGSVSEVQSLLYVAVDLKYITENMFNGAHNKAAEVAKLLNGFIKYLKKD
jgi:four helix bundle protein